MALVALPAAAAEPAAVPAKATAAAPKPVTATLHLTNGDQLSGQLQDSDSGALIRWESPAFVAPLAFLAPHVSAVRLPHASSGRRAGGDYCFELSGGDVAFGKLLAIREQEAELDVPPFGRLHVRRERLQRINPQRDHSGLLYVGPNGLAEWQPGSGAKGWREESGQLITDEDLVSLERDFRLPARVAIEIELAWKGTPDFVLALGADETPAAPVPAVPGAAGGVAAPDPFGPGLVVLPRAAGPNGPGGKPGAAFQLEVWQQDLVALYEGDQEADLALVQRLDAQQHRLRLQLYLDQERGRLLVHAWDGRLLAELQRSGLPTGLRPRIRLTNHHGTLRLERLRISRWNGESLQGASAERARIHGSDGSLIYGSVTAFDAATQEFVVRADGGEIRVAADRVDSVCLASAPAGAAGDATAVGVDDSRFSGQLLRIERGQAWLKSPGIAEPLGLPLAGLRSLVFPGHRDAGMAADAQPAGVLELDGVRLHGCLTDGRASAAASCLVWKSPASEAAVALRPGVSGQIVYRVPRPAKQPANQPAPQRPPSIVEGFIKALSGGGQGSSAATARQRVLHLRSGDTIPCDDVSIDDRGVTFRTALSDTTFVAHERVKALELRPEAAKAIKPTKIKRERLLTLPRLQQENPPTHLIRSVNGDYLRGRLVGLDREQLRVECRLEERTVPRERISRIIWLHPEEAGAGRLPVAPEGPNGVGSESQPTRTADGVGSESQPTRTADGVGSESQPTRRANGVGSESQPTRRADAVTCVQAWRGDGNRLTLAADQLAGTTLSGTSEVLGPCRVELREVDRLVLGRAIDEAVAVSAYGPWRLRPAPEPKFARSDGAQGESRSPGTESPLVGQPAPEFKLDLLGGQTFNLAEHRGRVVVLDFWATWCSPCMQSLPQVDRVVQEFAGQTVELIAVNLQEEPEQIAPVLERHKLATVVALDRDRAVADKYGAVAIPQTVIIDRTGRVARVFVGGGARLPDRLREALQKVAAER